MKMFTLVFLILFALVSPALASFANDPETMATYFDVAAKVIAGASILANVTPTPIDNVALKALSKVVDFLALNWFSFFKKK